MSEQDNVNVTDVEAPESSPDEATLSPDQVNSAPEQGDSTVSDASDAREPGALADQLDEVMAVAEDAPEVSSENEVDRKARIKRDMAVTGRERRGGVQSPAVAPEEEPDGTDVE